MPIIMKKFSEAIERGYHSFTKLSCKCFNEIKNYFSTYESDYYSSLFEAYVETCNYGDTIINKDRTMGLTKLRTMHEYSYIRTSERLEVKRRYSIYKISSWSEDK